MYSVLYLYVVGVSLILSGVIIFIKAIVDAQPHSPSLEVGLMSVGLIAIGLAVMAITRLLYLACFNSAAAAQATAGRR